jgi:hypothetical protein
MIQLLQLISNRQITMLKDIDYYYIPNMERIGIINFISKLDSNSVYIIIPIISMFGKTSDPHVILSKQFLITNNSSSIIIHDFLNYKLDQAIIDFGLINLQDSNYFQLIFKYKKVSLDFSNLP